MRLIGDLDDKPKSIFTHLAIESPNVSLLSEVTTVFDSW